MSSKSTDDTSHRKASLKDIAAELGVSTALVSYVINNKVKEARVSEEMAEKVRQTALKLNYRPNLIAKSLRSGKTNTIGLLVADISNPFFSGIARIIEDEARKHGYVVIFGSSDETAARSGELLDVFLTRQVDAVIVAPSEHTEDQVSLLVKRQMPVVLIDRYFPGVEADSVHIDNFQASFDAVEHLVKAGRRNIAMVAYDTALEHMRERIRGYREALRLHGIRFRSSLLKKVSHRHLAGDITKAVNELLASGADAVFFATCTLAVESLKRIDRAGVRVPEQLAVISFDESDAFDFFYAPLTHVSQPMDRIAREAVRLALENIRGVERKRSEVVVDAKLVVRASSQNGKIRKSR